MLATADKYTFRVHQDAHKTQIKQAVEALFDVARRRGPHLQGALQAQAPRRTPPAARGRGRRPSCRCARATRSRSSRAWRPTSKPCRFASPSPHLAGRRFVTYPGLRGDHEDRAREDPRRGSQEVRRPQRARPQDRPPPRRRRQAPVPQDRLQAHQGRRAGEGRRDRVRPEPLGVHRAAALRRRREGLHPRPEPPARRHDRASRAPAPTSRSATRCRWPRCRSARWSTTSSSSRAAARQLGRSAGAGIQLMAKEGD